MTTVSVKAIPVTFTSSNLIKVEMQSERLQGNVAFSNWSLESDAVTAAPVLMPVTLLVTNVPSDIATELSGLKATDTQIYLHVESCLEPVPTKDKVGNVTGWYFEVKYAGRFEIR